MITAFQKNNDGTWKKSHVVRPAPVVGLTDGVKVRHEKDGAWTYRNGYQREFWSGVTPMVFP